MERRGSSPATGAGNERIDAVAPRAPVVAVRISDPDLYDDAVATVTAVGAELAADRASSVDYLLVDDADTDAAGRDAWPVRESTVHVVGVSGAEEPLPDLADHQVALPDETDRLVALLTGPDRRGAGRVVTVVGAVGGVGASVLAAVLACRGALARPTMLVESDPWGGGADLLVGLDDPSPLRLDDMSVGSGHLDVEALWDAVPGSGQLGVLARRRRGTTGGGDRPGSAPDTDAVPTVHALRASGALVVCDAGRVEIADSVLGPADHVVLVTRGDILGTLAARDAFGRVPDGVAVTLVVRRLGSDPLQPDLVAVACDAPDREVLADSAMLRRLVDDGDLHHAMSAPRRARPRSVITCADRILDAEELRC